MLDHDSTATRTSNGRPGHAFTPTSLSPARFRSALRQLVQAAARRVEAQETAERDLREAGQSADRTRRRALEEIAQRHEAARREADAELARAEEEIAQRYEEQFRAVQREYEIKREQNTTESEEKEQAARKAYQHEVWLAESDYESTEGLPRKEFEKTAEALNERLKSAYAIARAANDLLQNYRLEILALPVLTEAQAEEESSRSPAEPASALDAALAQATELLDRFHRLTVAKVSRGLPITLLWIVAIAGAAAAGAYFRQWRPDPLIAYAAGGAVLFMAIVHWLMRRTARRRAADLYEPLISAVNDAVRFHGHAMRFAAQRRANQEAALAKKRRDELQAAKDKYEPLIQSIRDARQQIARELNERYPRLLADLRRRRDEERDAARGRHARTLADADRERDEHTRAAEQRHSSTRREAETIHAARWTTLANDWKTVFGDFQDAAADGADQIAQLFPDWDAPAWRHWSPPVTFAPVVPFGRLSVDLARVPGGVSDDPRLTLPGPTAFDLPALLAFPDDCSLLIEHDGPGREAAIATLQNVMLRLLTALPPGKVRFTLIDPVGLGQNFAGFMHLADYAEALVGERIWTEPRHIEQKLADLTEHMESVIQKYLRNDFETIADYNEQAGEIAEPYRFLVIADLPANFTEAAARRLASIVNSGKRCGVYTLIACDTRQPIPPALQMDDVRAQSVHLTHKEGRAVWQAEPFADWPLTLDAPPGDETLSRLVHLVGEGAVDSSRVEVPFATIAPPPEKRWSLDSGADLKVPLGRAGATRLQYLTLGHGTSQHVLVAGKTGSGKSTLLHVLITNLALWYDTDQIELYLVDFKKGVEFRSYVEHQLPHARAVAIESDREFGLSVLHRVDEVLKERGEKFRRVGAQDLAGYRRLAPDDPMPRTLLIIDEFQEFFTEDDKLAQDAALLLDRLVRQGRAFGVHVILGSQTLGGAYTLARSTMGQMAVRIALQCSETDAYLIMNEENSAARLLSRPGEAIYNDAGGDVGGNSPFQISWLSERERDAALAAVEELAEKSALAARPAPIVFEGNAPADIRRNTPLNAVLAANDWTDDRLSANAWLGDAIAIKDPIAATFRRQGGSNLLIVGQQDEFALAMMATSLVSLAAQHRPAHSFSAGDRASAHFVLLDGTPPDAPNAGYLQRLAESLPHPVRVVAWRDVAAAVNELAAELKRRQDSNDLDAPAIYLLVHGLQRFRMLRKSDDFGFSMGDPDAPPSPDKAFADLLRDGAPFGLHALVWCDTASTLDRSLDRQAMREFETRILFQMSGADSSNLIDSALAAKLGMRRALFYSEELGLTEKFRPYALPDADYVQRVTERLRRRAAASRRVPAAADPTAPTPADVPAGNEPG